jgi:hypothetical protein
MEDNKKVVIPDRIKNQLIQIEVEFATVIGKYYTEIDKKKIDKKKSDKAWAACEVVVEKAQKLMDPYEDGHYIREFFYDDSIHFNNGEDIDTLHKYFEYIEKWVTYFGRLDHQIRDGSELARLYTEYADLVNSIPGYDLAYAILKSKYFFQRVEELCYMGTIEGDSSAERLNNYFDRLYYKVEAIKHNMLSRRKFETFPTE